MPPQKPVDLGKGLGLYDTTSVRDKVRKWQTTGGGVLEQTDEVAVESDKDIQSKKSSKSASSHPRSKSEGNIKGIEIVDPPKGEKDAAGVIADAPTTPKSQADTVDKQPATDPVKPRIIERKPANLLDEDVKRASAPKKRVVSDGHWRRKHVDPKAKPPSPPKPVKVEKNHYGWVRPPLLPRPSDEPPSPPKPKPEPKLPVRIYAAKPRTQSFGDSYLSKRPEDSIPIRPISPVTPVKPSPRRLSKPRMPALQPSEEVSSPRHERSNRIKSFEGVSRELEDHHSSPDEVPRRTRLSKSKPPEVAGYETRRPSHRRSLSAEDAYRHSARYTNQQSSPRLDRDEEGERPRRRRYKRTSDESEQLDQPPDSPPELPKELNNFDEDAAKRRSSFRDEFKQYIPPKQRRSSGRNRTTPRFSYSPERIDRIPEPELQERIIEPPPQRQTSARIQSWLTETPDPFKEAPKSRSRRNLSFEKPSRRAMTESTIDTESTFDTETTITESTLEPRPAIRDFGRDRKFSRDVKPPLDRKVRAQSESLEYTDPDIQVEYASSSSVSTLKRSGARHGTKSPTTRDRAKSVSLQPARTASSYTESEITSSSIISSSIDPRGFDKPGEGEPKFSVARRLFPSTGKRLSTIASVETFNTRAQNAPAAMSDVPEAVHEPVDAVVLQDAPILDKLTELSNPTNPSVVSATRSRTSLKRKLTTHADLMTVLSMPASRSKSIISARSIRTHRSRLETATIEDLMKELSSDETKYMRELRTLADGVIPILLKCVLSKSDAAVAAGLFKSSPNDQKEAVAEASKVIHDLSVSIQRLKSLHTRIPKENHFSLLIWAQSAHSVYEKYIKSWRLGFQDVVVSLAVEGEGSTVSTPKSNIEGGAWDQGLPRNEDGYIIDGDGERVDVAFLLKRPLIRLKWLSKTFKGINIKKPSEQAGMLATKFEKLMEMARNKVDDEKARLEDEAAALIDATRARDPRSLAPLAGVKIDTTRRVRARDYFDFHLPHSSGQTVDNRVELLIRDDAPGRGSGGDILVCEINEEGRFLFLPPIEFKRMSARAGDQPGQIVVQVRGMSSVKEEWDEVFTLMTEDEEVRFEWIQWIGLSPVPPPINRVRSFKQLGQTARPPSSHGSSSLLSDSARTESTVPFKSRTPSPRLVDIPIGERAGVKAKIWSKDITSPRAADSDASSFSSFSLDSERATLHEKKGRYADTASFTSASSFTESDIRSNVTPPPRDRSPRRTTPRNLDEAFAMAGTAVDTGSPTIKKRAARYRTRKDEPQDLRQTASAQFVPQNSASEPLKKGKSIKKTSAPGGFSVWIPNSEAGSDSESGESDYDDESFVSSYLSGMPRNHYRTSSVPSIHLASVPKNRKRDEDYLMSGALQPDAPKTPLKPALVNRDQPSSAPSKLERKPVPAPSNSAPASPIEDKPPPPPPHRTPSANQVKFAPTPQFTPTVQVKRRSSSPLKHEYRPSSPSSESSLSEDESESDFSEESLTSDEELDDADVASTFVSSAIGSALSSVVLPNGAPTAPETLFSHPNGTIKPSESASQAPYRTVPHVVTVESKPVKCVATIFTWSDHGAWEILYPDDCSVVITPGLISAYPMSSSHTTDALPEERPLIAQELTPLVPLRRGTALDITIRSPPTVASKLKPGSSIIMFRSRSGEEGEILYNQINRARINNPTYIALQKARPSPQDGWAAAMDRQNKQRDAPSAMGSGWWTGLGRSKSYRASSRAHSTTGNTESSIGAMSSVLGAMKRFSGSNFLVDKAKSKMSMSRDGSDSLNSSGGSGARSPPIFVAGQSAAGAGISNAKVRLYVMQTKNRWQDLGSARLSILPKEDAALIAAPIMLHTGLEKRIKVSKKAGRMSGGGDGEVLLDVTLPEPCFERWARTGIGVSVWVDVNTGAVGVEGDVPKAGGVNEKRVLKYMIQMKNERECAYTFSLLGKLRY